MGETILLLYIPPAHHTIPPLHNRYSNPQALEPTDPEAGLQAVEISAEIPFCMLPCAPSDSKQRKLWPGSHAAGLTSKPQEGRQAGCEGISRELLGLHKC